jgi:uncharacterized protein YjdB
VENVVVTHLQITPATSSLPVGLHDQLKAEVTLSDGSVLDVTTNEALHWSSNDPTVASISSSGADKGTVTGVTPGTATITASGVANGQSFSATAEVTITNVVVTHLQITPATSSLPVGLHDQLKAEVTLSDGSVLDVTTNEALHWSSNDPTVASISSSGADKGTVTGVTPGTATITASGVANGQSFSATAEVEVEVPLAFFTTPDTITRDWHDADAYCKGQTPAARLPTRVELQNLFIQSTSATKIGQINNDMCDVHGWPLVGRCGGSTNSYWTSEGTGSSYHWGVGMHYGIPSSNGDTILNHVTCVR